jgi:hypothetical protein
MILYVTGSTTDKIPTGKKVALHNDDGRTLEVRDESFRTIATILDPRIHFHMDDLSTEIEIRGYIAADDDDKNPRYKPVTLWLK